MAIYQLSWLATVLKDAGLKVEEEPGWEKRGHGDMGKVVGVLMHHTAGPRAGNMPSLSTIIRGRPDLSGPLSNLALARDGTYFVVAAGRAYHAGQGYWQGVTDGNSSLIGIEAENTGLPNDNPWPKIQMDAYVAGVAALLKHIGKTSIMAVGHKEYATPKGRKIDPTFSMTDFRSNIDIALTGVPRPPPEIPPTGTKMKVVGVKPETLAFRDAPGGEQHGGGLPENTVVTRINTKGIWSNVVTPMNFNGWVATRFLRKV